MPTQVGNRTQGLCTDHPCFPFYLPTVETLKFLSILVLWQHLFISCQEDRFCKSGYKSNWKKKS